MNETEARRVIEMEARVWRAVMEKDGEALKVLFSEEYLEITLEGVRTDKGTITEQSPMVDEIEGYSMSEEKVVRLGESTFLLSYHLHLRGHGSGASITPEDRWATSVWRCSGGRWECCFFQQSSFPARVRENG